jgi:5'-nucleotidase
MDAKESPLVFIVDLDGTVADLDTALVDALPEHKDKILNRKEAGFTGHLETLVRQVMTAPGFFATLPLFPDAKRNIAYLQKRGVVVFSSFNLRDAPHGLSEKLKWIECHFGSELARSAVFSKDKTMIAGDYLIDDRPQTGRYKLLRTQYFPSRSYNSDETNRLADLWEETLEKCLV